MNKYRVLKTYPKQITNSGRLVALKPGGTVYLKKETQVLRLIKLGFLKPVVELPKKAKPEAKSEEKQPSHQEDAKRKAKSEFLSKKNKSE